jgi:DNA polymerase III epsilon subunit family exonuclease
MLFKWKSTKKTPPSTDTESTVLTNKAEIEGLKQQIAELEKQLADSETKYKNLLALAVTKKRAELAADVPDNLVLHEKVESENSCDEVPASELAKLPKSLKLQFVVVDVETTGLYAGVDEIIEIGAIIFDLTKVNHSTFNILVKPSKKIPQRITDLTGITNSMVDEEGVDLVTATTQLSEFIKDHLVVAYNMKFDKGFLDNAYKQCGLKFENNTECALELARKAFPGMDSYRLSELAEHFGFDSSGAHRALADCKLAGLIYVGAKRTLG